MVLPTLGGPITFSKSAGGSLNRENELDQTLFTACLIVLKDQSQLNIQTKPVEPLVDGGAQIQQVLNIECLTDFSDAPLLRIKFR